MATLSYLKRYEPLDGEEVVTERDLMAANKKDIESIRLVNNVPISCFLLQLWRIRCNMFSPTGVLQPNAIADVDLRFLLALLVQPMFMDDNTTSSSKAPTTPTAIARMQEFLLNIDLLHPLGDPTTLADDCNHPLIPHLSTAAAMLLDSFLVATSIPPSERSRQPVLLPDSAVKWATLTQFQALASHLSIPVTDPPTADDGAADFDSFDQRFTQPFAISFVPLLLAATFHRFQQSSMHRVFIVTQLVPRLLAYVFRFYGPSILHRFTLQQWLRPTVPPSAAISPIFVNDLPRHLSQLLVCLLHHAASPPTVPRFLQYWFPLASLDWLGLDPIACVHDMALTVKDHAEIQQQPFNLYQHLLALVSLLHQLCVSTPPDPPAYEQRVSDHSAPVGCPARSIFSSVLVLNAVCLPVSLSRCLFPCFFFY